MSLDHVVHGELRHAGPMYRNIQYIHIHTKRHFKIENKRHINSSFNQRMGRREDMAEDGLLWLKEMFTHDAKCGAPRPEPNQDMDLGSFVDVRQRMFNGFAGERFSTYGHCCYPSASIDGLTTCRWLCLRHVSPQSHGGGEKHIFMLDITNVFID